MEFSSCSSKLKNPYLCNYAYHSIAFKCSMQNIEAVWLPQLELQQHDFPIIFASQMKIFNEIDLQQQRQK